MWISSQAKRKSSEFVTSYTVAFCLPLIPKVFTSAKKRSVLSLGALIPYLLSFLETLLYQLHFTSFITLQGCIWKQFFALQLLCSISFLRSPAPLFSHRDFRIWSENSWKQRRRVKGSLSRLKEPQLLRFWPLCRFWFPAPASPCANTLVNRSCVTLCEPTGSRTGGGRNGTRVEKLFVFTKNN